MYTNYSYQYPQNNIINYPDDRFLLAPFLLGGLAGTALGYGISTNNQNNPVMYYPAYPIYPTYPSYPYTTISSNNYYY